MNRGTPVDRYYIYKFINQNKNYIKGFCLEIRDNRYGNQHHNINKLDILDINPENKEATIHGDLRSLSEIADNKYDCIILTQVLQYIDDVPSAVKECYRILKPAGTLLITVPTMSRIDPKENEYWRFTSDGLAKILKPIFGEKFTVQNFGNVLTGIGFWIGQAAEEFSKRELDHEDKDFPILIAAKAIK